MTERTTRTLIIGGGPAGYTAAIYAARANLEPILLTGIQPGGQLTITTDVENYPGFARAVQGPALMEAMHEQAAHVGTEIVYDTVTAVDLGGRDAIATCDSGDVYVARTLIIATGAQARWLGIPGEREYGGRGVSACATCDGFFYRGKVVTVIGGGNTAVEEALYLSNLASKVYLVHRRDRLRAEPILRDRLFANPKIEPVWNARPEAVVGDENGVTGLLLDVGGGRRVLDTHGIFVAIGHDPATALFKGQLAMTGGYIDVVPGTTRTSRAGTHACGDCADPTYKQAVVAAGMGCMAALEVEKWLAEDASRDQAAEIGETAMIGAY